MKQMKRGHRGVSTSLTIVLMIIILVIAAAVVYAWMMGYLDFSTERSKEAINVPSVINDATDTDLLVYVQNTGEDPTQLKQSKCLYVNGTLVPCTISGVNVSDGVATLTKLDVAILTYAGGAVLPGEKVEIKVTAVSGVFATKTAYPAGTTGVPAVDHFVFSTVSSPQLSGVPFNITITAIDRQGNHFWDYNGINTLTCSSGEITPAVTGNFSYGSWTGEVTVTGSTADTTITTAIQFNPAKTGTSNTFTLIKPSEAIWNKTYGGTGSEMVYELIATSDGGYAIAGSIHSSGDESSDFLLIKTDEFGNEEWNQTYEGTGDKVAYAVVEASDGGYILAGNGLLVKIDSSGNIEWNKTVQGVIKSLVVTSDNGYAITGYKDDDFWLAKTDANGNIQWDRTYGGTERERANKLVKTSDGGYAIAGSTNSSDSGYYDFWLVKTNATGYMEWNQTYKETNLSSYDEVSFFATSDGGYALAGRTYGGLKISFVFVKTDEAGNMEWKQTYTGAITGIPDGPFTDTCSMIETSHGGYAICANSAILGSDFWLIKTDEYGNVEWAQTYGGAKGDYA